MRKEKEFNQEKDYAIRERPYRQCQPTSIDECWLG